MPSIELDKIVYDRLVQLSKQEELPLSELVELLIERYVDINELMSYVSKAENEYNKDEPYHISDESIHAILEELKHIHG